MSLRIGKARYRQWSGLSGQNQKNMPSYNVHLQFSTTDGDSCGTVEVIDAENKEAAIKLAKTMAIEHDDADVFESATGEELEK